jgi:1,2-diacylglycerol-3-alpha-glucose alpha-1,2-galactosyltransferase
MKKISINMLSQADSKPGQGVGSAYLEQVKLVKDGASDVFDISVNSIKDADIIHHHTINLGNYFRMLTTKGINVSYVHFLPETLDGSIKLPKFAFDVFKDYVISFYKGANYLVVVNPIFIKELEKYNIDKKKIYIYQIMYLKQISINKSLQLLVRQEKD